MVQRFRTQEAAVRPEFRPQAESPPEDQGLRRPVDPTEPSPKSTSVSSIAMDQASIGFHAGLPTARNKARFTATSVSGTL